MTPEREPMGQAEIQTEGDHGTPSGNPSGDPCGDPWDRITAHQRRFLTAFRFSGTLAKAGRESGVARQTHYTWVGDPDYDAAFANATADSVDYLEDVARKRATEGWDEPIFHKGDQVGVRKKYSDGLLMFLLRGERPAKYAEHRVTESHVSGEVTHRATSDDAQVSAADKLRELRERRSLPAAGLQEVSGSQVPEGASNASQTPSGPSENIVAGHDPDSDVIDAEIVDD